MVEHLAQNVLNKGFFTYLVQGSTWWSIQPGARISLDVWRCALHSAGAGEEVETVQTVIWCLVWC